MREPITLPAQARALRALTGLPLAHCRRVLVLARTEFHRGVVMKRRATIAKKQMELDEQPVSGEVIAAEFAKIRAKLSGEVA